MQQLPVYGQMLYQLGLVDEEQYNNLTTLGYLGASLIGAGDYYAAFLIHDRIFLGYVSESFLGVPLFAASIMNTNLPYYIP